MTKMIGEGWEGLRTKLQLGGMAPDQVNSMERVFFAGAYTAVTNLAQTLHESGDQACAALLADYTFEVVEAKEKFQGQLKQATEEAGDLAARKRDAVDRFRTRGTRLADAREFRQTEPGESGNGS